MTIKVVKRGTPPSEIIYAHTCIKCKSELEFNESDAVFKSDQREGNAYVLKCPVCEYSNWIDKLRKKGTDRYSGQLWDR